MGQEYLFLIMNELLHFEKLLIFLEKKPFALLFSFLFVDLGFSFLPLKYFIYFKRRSFRSGIVQLLDMRACKEGTAEALFNNINSIPRENRVNQEHCIVVGLDNTAVNVGKNNSIMTRVLAKNKNIFINGCPCHIIHNTANKAAERFSEVSRFDVEDFLVDLFHWFDKSSKRKVTSNFQL